MVSLLLFWRSCLACGTFVRLSVCAPARSAFSPLSLSLSLHICIPLFPAHTHLAPTNTHTHSPMQLPCICPKFTPGDMGTMLPWAQAARRTKYSCATQGAQLGEGEKVPASPSREPALIILASRGAADPKPIET